MPHLEASAGRVAGMVTHARMVKQLDTRQQLDALDTHDVLQCCFRYSAMHMHELQCTVRHCTVPHTAAA